MIRCRASALEASLTGASLEKSIAWYTDVLGFTIDRRHQRNGKAVAVSLRAGSMRILLTQEDGTKGADHLKGEGFSLQITTSQSAHHRDLDGFRLTMSSAQAG
jgi:catechol 2,3-dioxygenase-like lactoylglutathione lyase family enzyme